MVLIFIYLMLEFPTIFFLCIHDCTRYNRLPLMVIVTNMEYIFFKVIAHHNFCAGLSCSFCPDTFSMFSNFLFNCPSWRYNVCSTTYLFSSCFLELYNVHFHYSIFLIFIVHQHQTFPFSCRL